MSKGTGPLSKLYNSIIIPLDQVVPKSIHPFWFSAAGPRTVFFWAPLFKWGLVIAGLGDIISRPASNISVQQSGALAVTGILWSRYSYIIIPRNYNLLAVNVVVFLTQAALVYRALKWKREHPDSVLYNHFDFRIFNE